MTSYTRKHYLSSHFLYKFTSAVCVNSGKIKVKICLKIKSFYSILRVYIVYVVSLIGNWIRKNPLPSADLHCLDDSTPSPSSDITSPLHRENRENGEKKIHSQGKHGEVLSKYREFCVLKS